MSEENISGGVICLHTPSAHPTYLPEEVAQEGNGRPAHPSQCRRAGRNYYATFRCLSPTSANTAAIRSCVFCSNYVAASPPRPALPRVVDSSGVHIGRE